MSEIIQYLQTKQTAIAAVSQSLTAKQMIQATSIAIYQNAGISKCTKESIYESVLQAARMGLDCSGLHGHGHLVPYGNKCTFQAGWRGLITIAVRSGAALSMKATIVYSNDVFDWDEGLRPDIKHKPQKDGPRGEAIAAYCVAYFAEGDPMFWVVTSEDARSVQAFSKGGGAWKTHFPSMMRKTAVRRLCSFLPQSLELADALDLEVAGEVGRPPAEDLRAVEPALLAANKENTIADVKKKIKKRKKREPKTEELPPPKNLGDVIAQNNSALMELVPDEDALGENIPF